MAINNLNVRIFWALPFNNYMPIDAYKIFILDTTGLVYNLDQADCDGSLP
jgi:hypothetical protein